MPTVVSCQCGQRFQAADWLAGREVPCPSCGTTLSVPRPPDAAAPATVPASTPAKTAETAAKIVVACKCGKKFQAPGNLLGKVVKCPSCGNPLKVQKATPKPAPKPAAPAADGLFDAPLDDGGMGLGAGAGFGQDDGFGQGAGLGPGGGLGDMSLGGLPPGGMQSGGFGGQQSFGYPPTSNAPVASGGGGSSFELSNRALVILMSVGGGSIFLLLIFMFIVPWIMAPRPEPLPPEVPAVVPFATLPAPAPWKGYAAPNGAYSVEFPGDPVVTPASPIGFNALPGIDTPASLMLNDGTEYAVGRWQTMRAPEDMRTLKVLVNLAMDGIGKSGAYRVTGKQDLMVGDKHAVDARISGRVQDKDFEGTIRLIRTETYLYVAFYTTVKGKFNAQDASHFLQTYQVNN